MYFGFFCFSLLSQYLSCFFLIYSSCAIALESCIAVLAVIFALFFFSFASLYNTVINSNHNFNWFANRLWLHFYCIDVRPWLALTTLQFKVRNTEKLVLVILEDKGRLFRNHSVDFKALKLLNRYQRLTMKFLFETFINSMRCLKADSQIRKFGEAIKTEKFRPWYFNS